MYVRREMATLRKNDLIYSRKGLWKRLRENIFQVLRRHCRKPFGQLLFLLDGFNPLYQVRIEDLKLPSRLWEGNPLENNSARDTDVGSTRLLSLCLDNVTLAPRLTRARAPQFHLPPPSLPSYSPRPQSL